MLNHLEHDLEFEKKKRAEAEMKLYNLLFAQKQTAPVCLSDGKPNYKSYSQILEGNLTIQDLLALSNEELEGKQVLIKKVRNVC